MARTILIMAAGTGGHIFPGLAIAKELVSRGWKVRLDGHAVGHGEDARGRGRHPMVTVNMTRRARQGRDRVARASREAPRRLLAVERHHLPRAPRRGALHGRLRRVPGRPDGGAVGQAPRRARAGCDRRARQSRARARGGPRRHRHGGRLRGARRPRDRRPPPEAKVGRMARHARARRNRGRAAARGAICRPRRPASPARGGRQPRRADAERPRRGGASRDARARAAGSRPPGGRAQPGRADRELPRRGRARRSGRLHRRHGRALRLVRRADRALGRDHRRGDRRRGRGGDPLPAALVRRRRAGGATQAFLAVARRGDRAGAARDDAGEPRLAPSGLTRPRLAAMAAKARALGRPEATRRCADLCEAMAGVAP